MKKIVCTLVGSILDDGRSADGQTVKTKILYDTLSQAELFDHLFFLNLSVPTYQKPFIFLKLLSFYIKSDLILFSVSRNGMRLLYPLFYYLNKLFPRHIAQITIGGGLANRTVDNPKWIKYMNGFDRNFVEVLKMKTDLERQGLHNADVIPNFKNYDTENNDTVHDDNSPRKLCTFSRICKTKGIEDAISAVEIANKQLGFSAYTLTIFGKVDADYIQTLDVMKKNFPDYIEYGGVVPYNDCIETLNKYYVLLFPTYHTGEGFPGTLLDAFAAGLPVIATKWNHNESIIDDGKNGWLVEVHKPEQIAEKLIDLINGNTDIDLMRQYCIQYVQKYTPTKALLPLYEYIKNEVVVQ